MPDDHHRRLLVILLAAAAPVAVGAGRDSADSGADLEVCIPWEPTIQGSCPDGQELPLDTNFGPHVHAEPGPAEFADGACCYTVTTTNNMGCGCSHGRPLRVHAHPIVAAPTRTRGWFNARAPAPVLDGLSTADRQLLAHHWASIAASEHGSIAAFHRLGLELLAIGAPADLIAACQRAAADETRHARLAFTLASRFAGVPIGPATLDLPHPLPLARTLVALAEDTVRSACVEETLAIAAAIALRSTATDPAVCFALDRIVADETRHAAFAWRLVRYLVDLGGAPVHAAVQRAFAAAPTPGGGPGAPPAHLARWGCVSDARLAAAVAQARRAVVDPAAAALCA